MGVAKKIPELIVSAKFEPLDSWLPPHYDVKYNLSFEEILSAAFKKNLGIANSSNSANAATNANINKNVFDKYRMHMVSDKAIADCVEAIIGAYLITSGPQAALRVMNWFGLKVLPKVRSKEDGSEIHVLQVFQAGLAGFVLFLFQSRFLDLQPHQLALDRIQL